VKHFFGLTQIWSGPVCLRSSCFHREGQHRQLRGDREKAREEWREREKKNRLIRWCWKTELTNTDLRPELRNLLFHLHLHLSFSLFIIVSRTDRDRERALSRVLQINCLSKDRGGQCVCVCVSLLDPFYSSDTPHS